MTVGVQLHSFLTSTAGASRAISRIVRHRSPTAETLVQAQSMKRFAMDKWHLRCGACKSKENELQGDVHELTTRQYRGAGKSLARPGGKQATATEDFEFRVSHL